MRPVMPALFTSPVTVPNRSIAAGTTVAAASRSARSTRQQQHACTGCLARKHDLGGIRLTIAVGEHQVVSVGGEPFGDRGADAATGPGDDRDGAVRGIRLHGDQPMAHERGSGAGAGSGRTIGRMAREEASPPEGNSFTRFFERVDRALEPVFGAPPITADDDRPETPADQQTCPICGHPMFEHVIDHSTPNTVLVCPTDDRLPERDESAPYNELGMPATGRRLEKYEERAEEARRTRRTRRAALTWSGCCARGRSARATRSPSRPCRAASKPDETALFERGVAAVGRLGFVVRVAPSIEVGRHRWWMSAPPADIAAELNGLFRDPDVRAILPLTGGRAALSYLDLLDFDAVRTDPKPLLGFSDIATLHLALHARTGLVTLHSDLLTHGFGYWDELADDRRREVEDVYRRVLTGDPDPVRLPQLGIWECWRPGRATGRLIGGLLNRLVRVQATPHALDANLFDGALLFWEEVGTSDSVVWNDLHVLRQAGVLDRIAGMIVGPTSTVELLDEGPGALRDVVLDVLGDRDIPVLGNVDIGHEPPNVPLPLGVLAEVDADAASITLLEPALER